MRGGIDGLEAGDRWQYSSLVDECVLPRKLFDLGRKALGWRLKYTVNLTFILMDLIPERLGTTPPREVSQ